jgi:hypothetical protein
MTNIDMQSVGDGAVASGPTSRYTTGTHHESIANKRNFDMLTGRPIPQQVKRAKSSTSSGSGSGSSSSNDGARDNIVIE